MVSACLLPSLGSVGCNRCGRTTWTEGVVQLEVLHAEPSEFDQTIVIEDSEAGVGHYALLQMPMRVSRRRGLGGSVRSFSTTESFGPDCVGLNFDTHVELDFEVDRDGSIVADSIEEVGVTLQYASGRRAWTRHHGGEVVEVHPEEGVPLEGSVLLEDVEWGLHEDCDGQTLWSDLQLTWAFESESEEIDRQACWTPANPLRILGP